MMVVVVGSGGDRLVDVLDTVSMTGICGSFCNGMPMGIKQTAHRGNGFLQLPHANGLIL